MIINLCVKNTVCCFTPKCSKLKALDLSHLQSCSEAEEKCRKLPISLCVIVLLFVAGRRFAQGQSGELTSKQH